MGLVEFSSSQGTVVVELDDDDPGYVRASSGELIAKAKMGFGQALDVIRPVASTVIERIESLPLKPSRIEIELGIKLNARTGAVLASAGGDCHIKLRLCWGPDDPPSSGGDTSADSGD